MLSKKLFLSSVVLLFLASFLFVGSVCASSVMWSQIYEIERHQVAYSLIETSDGGYALAGGYSIIDDFWLVKIDEWGNIQWNRTYGGEKNDYATSLVETSDGGYALAGRTESFGQGDEDFWLVKTDVNGTMQWNRTYGGSDSERACSMVQTSDGGYALAGYMQYSDVRVSDFLVITRGPDFWLVKTDSNGNMIWNQTYGGKENEYAYSVVQTTDGGYAIAGHTNSFGAGGYDFWLVKTDVNGSIQWNRTYGGPDSESAYSVVQTSDGGYAIFGNGLLIKTDEYGYMVWNQTYGGGDGTRGYSGLLVATSDGGYAFVIGSWLIKTDAQGNVVWSERYEPRYEWSDLQLSSVIATSDGGYVIAGNIFEFFTGKSVILVAKTNECGVIPEFPSWTPVLVMVVALVAMIVVYRYNLKKLRGWAAA